MASDIHINATAVEAHDAKLVARCRAGDQTAWDELVERYQRLIITIPRRAGLSEEQATDVFQEVFLTLLEKINEITQPEKIRSWIVTTAKFKTWAVIRGQKEVSPLVDEESGENPFESLPDSSPLADDVLVELEQQHLIRAALQQIEERCRTIISMIYLAQNAASYSQVASAIGVGETSISPMRKRCLDKLAKILKK